MTPAASDPAPPAHEGLLHQLRELDSRFWIVNTMEMFERLAYYGVRTVVPLYMVLPLEQGGPEFSHVQKGAIFAAWAAVQSLLPMFTGGFADRYGHKQTIGVAILLKIVGYLMMAHFLSYLPFFLGCMVLAAGTAVFKPGVQGTLAATLKPANASVGWGIFYQLVNIGGFLGPVLAGVLRLMDWVYVFYSCAIIVSINFAWLPFYKDPSQEARQQGGAAAQQDQDAQKETWAAMARSVSAETAGRWAAFFAAMGLAWTVVTFGVGTFARDLAGLAGPASTSPALPLFALLVGGALSLAGLAFSQLEGRRGLGALSLWALLGWCIAVLSAGLETAPVQALKEVAAAHGGLWDPAATLAASGLYTATAGALLGATLASFAARKARLDQGDLSVGAVFLTSVAGLFQPRVLWFCLVFSGFWLMFNQVFDLLPNVIDDWVDSSGLIAAVGGAFGSPGVPLCTAVLLAAIYGFVSAAVILLALRPDRHDRRQVGWPAWIVAGVGMAMAAFFVLTPLGSRLAASLDGSALAGTPVPALLGLSPLLLVLFGTAAIGRLGRLPGTPVAAVAGLLGLFSGTWYLWSRLQEAAPGLVAMAAEGKQVNPEWMINLNPGLIVFTMIFFAWVSSFLRPLTSILVGMCIATLGAVIAGTATVGWICLAGVLVFSMGEMLSSPKKMEYLASLARKGQEGLFMGYANVPVAIGWISGSIFAGNRYEEAGDKANLARRYLVEELHWTAEKAEALPRGEVVSTLAGELGSTALQVQSLLFETYHPERLWIDIGLIGVLSVVGMIVYDRVLRRIDAKSTVA